MPTVSNINLILTTTGSNVEVRVDYDVTFTKFERQLVTLGLSYDTHVTIHDFDGGSGPGAEIFEFYPGRNVLAVTAGNGDQVLHESESRTVSRASLQVDTGGDEDELKANIRVHANGWLEEFTADAISAQKILLG